MGETKRFYWLKLQEDFFEDDTIDFIESQENGEKYCLFYLKLCLKALKSEGKLIRYVGNMLIPYDEKGLAKLTRTDVDTVRCALALFDKIGLVSRLDTGEIFINQLNEMVGTETDKAKLMRQKRAKEKLISNNVTPMLPECYTDIEKEKELEKDIEIERETTTRFHKPSISEIQEYCNERHNNINAEKFFNHYESNGWYVGKNKMKDWKACVRTWEQNEKKYATSQNGGYVNNRRPASDSNTNVDF